MAKAKLNDVSSEYFPNANTEIENDLILNWYPHRVIKRCGYVSSLLELGIGHGFASKIFSATCEDHIIVDGSSIVIDQFKKNNNEFCGEIIEEYFEDYYPNELFDVIVMGFILEHVDDPMCILKKYRNFLKPGGKLYVAVPNAKSMSRRLGLELGIIDDIYSLNANDITLGHQRQYCLETLTHDVESAGYCITHTEGIYLKPLPLNNLKLLTDFKDNLNAMLTIGIGFPELCVAILIELEIE